MLSVSHLHKEYANVVAVNDVSLEVRPGTIFGLLGPNGAGKTTTIRMILNIIIPDRGEVRFDGKPFDESTQNIVGYLPEERGLYRKSTVLNTILYFSALRGMERSEAKRRAMQWLERFELASYSGRKVEELSKGNQQKVQFIGSIIHKPRLLILDEPFSGLDPINQILLTNILMDLKKEGTALIFSTHVMEQAEKLCESITLINKGNIVVEGDLQLLKTRFGKNAVRLEYSGDGTFLKTLPTVRKALIYENSAELELDANADMKAILRGASERLDIRSFQVQEASLNSIFLEVVGAQNAPQPSEPAK
jgi:ABC-2 type transport system ATP-binding protein